jgi:hypothetical protein
MLEIRVSRDSSGLVLRVCGDTGASTGAGTVSSAAANTATCQHFGANPGISSPSPENK